jgi:hypothetical protein
MEIQNRCQTGGRGHGNDLGRWPVLTGARKHWGKFHRAARSLEQLCPPSTVVLLQGGTRRGHRGHPVRVGSQDPVDRSASVKEYMWFHQLHVSDCIIIIANPSTTVRARMKQSGQFVISSGHMWWVVCEFASTVLRHEGRPRDGFGRPDKYTPQLHSGLHEWFAY